MKRLHLQFELFTSERNLNQAPIGFLAQLYLAMCRMGNP